MRTVKSSASGLVESLKLMSLCLSSHGGVSDPQDRPVWRMCMGGSTGNPYQQENHRNMKNRVLQMPLSDKTLSVNIHRSPKEGLLCTPTPHSCCQVI
uniref:Uncharacterized protein n=1 Tax=Neogobius melanostomus TaxID=47308 RepID=A0A8C6SGG2_9GOBI